MSTRPANLPEKIQHFIDGKLMIIDGQSMKLLGQVALGIDAKGGMVATEGWAEVSDIPTIDLARRFADAGAAAIIFTDVERDGMLGGANADATRALAAAVAVPVIASGGVASAAEISALRAAPEGIAGAILGRALYDGRISPAEALAWLHSVHAEAVPRLSVASHTPAACAWLRLSPGSIWATALSTSTGA